MTIYIDSQYRCYTTNDGTRTPIETAAFNGKCKTFIEGYRFIPEGATWQRADGAIFHGEMITPAVNAAALQKAQEQYEEDLAQMSDMQTALEILGVEE